MSPGSLVSTKEIVNFVWFACFMSVTAGELEKLSTDFDWRFSGHWENQRTVKK